VKHTLAAWAACAALASCSTLNQPAQGPDDTLSGRLSVQVDAHNGAPARNVSAAFDLRGGPERGEMQLTSPLGTVMAQARWSPSDVVLKSSDGEKRFRDLPALADEVLGEPLPLGALFDWLRGRPWAGAPSSPLPTPGAGFEQLGWTVALERRSEGWIVAHRSAPPAVTVRAKLAP
jgi:outer membrane lipoprotein LolB